jgi:hypothetical protein
MKIRGIQGGNVFLMIAPLAIALIVAYKKI